MADRRMFSKKIVDTDAFLDMPATARLLYYDLAMRADDEGFIGSPKGVMRTTGASNDDMNVLIMRKFVIPFDSGVVVIRHWKIHNYIQNDRFKPTQFIEEKSQLSEKNGVVSKLDTECIQAGYKMDTQDRLEIEIGKSKSKDSSIAHPEVSGESPNPKKPRSFIPPTLEQVEAYVKETGMNVDPEQFFTYFTTPNDAGQTWIDSLGKPVRNWKQKMQTWNRMGMGAPKTQAPMQTQQPPDRYANLKRLMEEFKDE